MAVTRINNNQITDASAGNVYVGINAGTKLQDYSITAGKIANSLTYGSDLTITGNLTVNGQTTTIDTVSTVIEDPVIVLASNQSGTPAVDIGFIGERGDQNNIAFVWDESADEFVTAFTSSLVTNTTITISSYANFHTNDANIGGNLVINGTTSLIGNITSALNVTGNITGGNLLTEGQVVATGNVTGGNINTGGQVVATGNVTGTGIVMSGNITGGNILTGGRIVATGNIDANNVNAVNDLTAEHIYTTGNAYIGGNLIVSGNITYINIDDLRIEDPIILLGTGPNGAPLTSDDNLDRGIYMEYYVGAQGNAFMGWQNSTGNLIAAANVVFASNDVISVNTYGTFQAGNLYIESALSTGNITGTGIVMSGNTTSGNLLTGGQVVATGNVTGGNINTGGQVVATGNITGGNLILTGAAIDSSAARITINSTSADTDFAVNGDTRANVFYVDAGTGTASFGNATQTTGALVAFNDPTSILMPVGNTAQRPGSGVLGMLRFNSTDDNLEIYSTAGWEAVGVPVFTVIADEQFNGDGSTVAFVLGSEQTTASCIVSINGVVQIPTIAYSVSGSGTSTLTFTEAPEPGDLIDVRQITTTTSVTSIANTGGNAIIATSPTSADINVTGNIVPASNVAFNLGSPTNFWNELYLSGNSIYLGDIILKANAGNLRVRNFDDTADAAVEATFISTSTTSGNLQIGLNHIEATNVNGEITLSPNGTGNTQLQSNIVRIGKQNTNVQLTSWGTGNIDLAVNSSNIASVSSSGLKVTGSIEATGGFIGLDATAITNGTSSMSVIASGGNIRANVGGATVGTFFSGGLSIPGIINSGSNGVGNIGSATGTFNTIFARATSAQYADLAEKYVADAEYTPGTVVVFGGDKEVTVTSTDADRAVAGVISTNPSYIMNGGLEAEYVATVALTGRVPCRVTGTVRKGDLMVSAGYGLARAEADPRVGTVIGKALENHEGTEGVIEVVVGRF
jgi:hypothetical protein